MPKTEIIDRDYGYKKFMAEMDKLVSKPYVKSGLIGKTRHKNTKDLTVAEVGIIHEFGAPRANIPSRPFMRNTYEKKKELWMKETKKWAAHITLGFKTVKDSLGLLGETIQKDIKVEITNGKFAPLKPRTIARKKSAKPLIDTAQLLNSVNYETVMK